MNWSIFLEVVTAVAAIAVPLSLAFGGWMFFISSSVKVIKERLDGKGGMLERIQNIESDKFKSHQDIYRKIGEEEGKLEEQGKIISSHAVRITASEKEIIRLRDKQDRARRREFEGGTGEAPA